MILLRFFLKSNLFFKVPEVKLKRIPASKTFFMLSGAISQCFNCSLENCSATYGSFTFGLLGNSRGNIIKGLCSAISSSLLYSYPLARSQGFRLNSFEIFSDRSAECSSLVMKRNGLLLLLKLAISIKEGLRERGSFSSGYFFIISIDR